MTRIQDDPQNSMSAKGKCSYPNLRRLPKNKMSAKKKYFTIDFIHSIHQAFQILCTFSSQCHCPHIHSQCLYCSHIHSTSPCISLPLNTTYHQSNHCIIYTTLLKTLHSHFWWDVLPCHYDPHWLSTTFIFFGL